jgi:transcriptional regulator with XRE-family HTH domain
MKSVHSGTYKAAIKVLRNARMRAGLTQQQLAKRLRRPQSFVAKVEQCERRIDIAEFIQIATALGASPTRLFAIVARPLS